MISVVRNLLSRYSSDNRLLPELMALTMPPSALRTQMHNWVSLYTCVEPRSDCTGCPLSSTYATQIGVPLLSAPLMMPRTKPGITSAWIGEAACCCCSMRLILSLPLNEKVSEIFWGAAPIGGSSPSSLTVPSDSCGGPKPACLNTD